MPKVFPLSRYPTQYGELMMRAAMNPEPIVLNLGGVTKAASLRSKLYSFRVACDRAPDEARAMNIDVGMIGLVLIQINRDAGTLTLSNRNYCPESKAIDEALAGLPPAVIDIPTIEGAPDPAKFIEALSQEKYK